jgi:integrase/recombinase XerC
VGRIGVSSHPSGGQPPSPSAFAGATVALLREQGRHRPETLAQLAEGIEHFALFLERGLGITSMAEVGPEQVRAFLGARQTKGSPASYGRRSVRRTSVRNAFRAGRELGIVDGDPTIDIDLGPNASLPARPLTDAEIEVCRSFAFGSLRDRRRSTAWALTEATGRTSEIGFVRAGDVDLASSRVWLSGSTDVDPRWGPLTEWGSEQLDRRLRAVGDEGEPVIVWRSIPKRPRAAASQAVMETLKAAGLRAPDVRPRSVVAWAGRVALEAGTPIDRVTRLLGMRSMDEAARFLRFDWRNGVLR